MPIIYTSAIDVNGTLDSLVNTPEVLLNIVDLLPPVDQVCFALTSHYYREIVLSATGKQRLGDVVIKDVSNKEWVAQPELKHHTHEELILRMKHFDGKEKGWGGQFPCSVCVAVLVDEYSAKWLNTSGWCLSCLNEYISRCVTRAPQRKARKDR